MASLCLKISSKRSAGFSWPGWLSGGAGSRSGGALAIITGGSSATGFSLKETAWTGRSANVGINDAFPPIIIFCPRMSGWPESFESSFFCAQRVISATETAPLLSRSDASPSRQSRKAWVAKPPV